jgi:glycosyltransferase involved in cell wall biosynthesis
LADDLDTPSVVIPNGYREELFRRLPSVARDRELAFLGRLVSDKGVDILLHALERLATCGLRPALSVIGEGPEEHALRGMSRDLGLEPQVRFLGARTGEELPRLLNAHEILVVPSRYHEPFGTVALEGIACGCVVVGTHGGGLPEAIGACGITVPNGDAGALANALVDLLRDAARRAALRAAAPEHLARHSSAAMVAAYARVIEAAARPDTLDSAR